MRAVVLEEYGGPEVLTLRDIPEPAIGPEDVLVDVTATAMNRADLLQRMGLYPGPDTEFEVPGLEYAGVVAAAGPQPFVYHFYVVKDDRINAFALPAGYIYVHTETILAARDVSELAGVIAHEVGHVVRRHVAKNYGRQRGVGSLRRIGVYAAALLGGNILER